MLMFEVNLESRKHQVHHTLMEDQRAGRAYLGNVCTSQLNIVELAMWSQSLKTWRLAFKSHQSLCRVYSTRVSNRYLGSWDRSSMQSCCA